MGYDVTVCSNGNDAWQRIKKENYHMMIFDWVMPGITGTELCKKIRTLRGDSYRYIILLTGNDGANDIIEGLKSGADDYLVKPVSIAQLKARINVGRRLIAYETELKNTEKDIRLSCYRTLTELAEARDYETGAHLARIAGLSKRLAQEYGCDEEFCNQIELFSPMHDIGKVGIPDGILHLPRALNPSEFEIMKSHLQTKRRHKRNVNRGSITGAASVIAVHVTAAVFERACYVFRQQNPKKMRLHRKLRKTSAIAANAGFITV